MARVEKHIEIEKELSKNSDENLLQLISTPEICENGSGVISLNQNGSKVFVKLISLSEVELRPENKGSTANFFQLPIFYQYRIGSCGFGVWRELEIHRMANEWVTSGECTNFPLLHHWRVLPITRSGYDDKMSLEPWDNNGVIHKRVSAIEEAKLSAVLFLEYFPLTLNEWFKTQWFTQSNPMELVKKVETSLDEVLLFLNERKVLHMDSHFENIVTDGDSFFVCDYGLALSNTFQLDDHQQNFFNTHLNFDRCTYLSSLVHAIVSQHDPRVAWRQPLQEIVDGKYQGKISNSIHSYLKKWKPLVLELGEFYDRLRTDLNSAYPAKKLQNLLEAG